MTRQGGWPSTGFAEVLKRLREESTMTQKELAVAVHCHYRTISQLERGTHEPAWPLVVALARALGVTTDVFFAAAQLSKTTRPRRGKKKH